MSLPNNAHVQIGETFYRLDEDYEQSTGRRCYIHGGRSILPGRTEITGAPGSQELKEGYLVWKHTRFDGEGQVVLDPSDAESAFRFYRSEGLNARTAGQLSLNKSILSETVSTTSTTATKQGAADFADVGSPASPSTTSGTDRKINTIGATGTVGMSASITPGASNVQFDFYLFQDPFTNYATTIQGDDFTRADGSPSDSGTDKVLTRGDIIISDQLSGLTGGVPVRIDLYASVTDVERGQTVRFQVIEESDGSHGFGSTLNNAVAGSIITVDNTSGLSATLSFTPKGTRDYRVKIAVPSSIEPTPVELTVDKILYGADITEDTATIEVWNQTGGVSVSTQTISVTATAAGSKVGSISFQAAAGTDYRARVKRTAGQQAIWVDKVVTNILTGAAWTIDCMDFGVGSSVVSPNQTGSIWAVAHATGADTRQFVYNPSTDTWDIGDDGSALDSSTGTNLTCRAMAHSDLGQYALLSSGEVVSWTAAGVDTLRAHAISGPVGMAVAQDRLFVLDEGGSGTTIYSMPLEAADVDVTSAATVDHQVITSEGKSPDTNLRQRMCGTPTGARYFINYGNVTAKVYETDSSGATLATRELADLGAGVKATAITHVGGITFVGAQFYGDGTASDTDKKPRSCLFAIDQNGVLQLVEFFREYSPDVRAPQFLVPWQTDLYVLQGNYVWRHDLRNGGLYLEYELPAASGSNQRALAILFGRVFAAYTTEIFVGGSVGTYRQSSTSDGSSLTSSIFDYGLPAAKKALTKIEVVTDTLPSNTSVAIEYQTDQDGTWTLAGTMTTGSKQTFFIIGTSFYTLQLRAKLRTSDGVGTPVLKGVTIWASAAEDEEYFDLVLRTEDEDSYDRIADQQADGGDASGALVNLWRSKAVTPFVDGYGRKAGPGDSYLVTIEDFRVENNSGPEGGEGRVACTLRVVR